MLLWVLRLLLATTLARRSKRVERGLLSGLSFGADGSRGHNVGRTAVHSLGLVTTVPVVDAGAEVDLLLLFINFIVLNYCPDNFADIVFVGHSLK